MAFFALHSASSGESQSLILPAAEDKIIACMRETAELLTPLATFMGFRTFPPELMPSTPTELQVFAE